VGGWKRQGPSASGHSPTLPPLALSLCSRRLAIHRPLQQPFFVGEYQNFACVPNFDFKLFANYSPTKQSIEKKQFLTILGIFRYFYNIFFILKSNIHKRSRFKEYR